MVFISEDVQGMGKRMNRFNQPWRMIELPQVATWERAKKNKVYPAGCSLLQVSATKGQLVYLHEAQTVDSKYCVIMPDTSKILPFYLYRILEFNMEEFLSKEQTGLNIKPEILHRFPVQFYESMEIQKFISDEQYFYEMKKMEVQKQIEMLKQMKAYLLDKFFC